MGRRAFVGGLAMSCAGCALAGTRALEAGPLQDAARRGVPGGEEGGLNPTPARWNRALPNDSVECGVCPHACRIAPDERGTCGTRENRKGTAVHARPLAPLLARPRSRREEAVLPRAARQHRPLARDRGLQPRVPRLPELGDLAGPARADPDDPPAAGPGDRPGEAEGRAARRLHLHGAGRLLRVRPGHRPGRAPGRRAHDPGLERLHPGAAARRPVPRDRGVQGGPEGLRRRLLQAAHGRRAVVTCSRRCAGCGGTAPGPRS